MLISIGLAWYVIGVLSFIFWWTKDYNITVFEVPLTLLIGIIGPIAFLIGWVVHGDMSYKDSKILIKKRR